MIMEQWIFLLLGLIVGVIGCFLYFSKRHASNLKSQAAIQADMDHLSHEKKQLTDQIEQAKQSIEQYRLIAEEKNIKLTGLEVENIHLIKELETLKEEKASIQKQLTTEFENIAGRILSRSSEEITTQQNKRLNDLLSPFKEKITAFENKVTETYEKELRDKLNLEAEVKRLFELNQRISEEAGNLTKALKGDVKKLGNWGELILERILEQSGLMKGREYQREVVMNNAEGKTIRPDVILHLPDQKHLIIDSKISLHAYERYVSAKEEATRQAALKAHLESMRTHIRSLHEKNYASSVALNTPDFVLMFIPVESSFAAAIEGDNELFAFAWERKIVPVSPSTLLATLRTIASIWKQDNQNKNAMEIAKRSGDLYDKLVGFVSDFEKVGKAVEQAQNSYNSAFNKLSTGKGNLIGRAEKIRELGAKNTKSLPPTITDN